MKILKTILRKILFYSYCCYYYPALGAIKVYLSIQWSPWNPWTIARLNLAWQNYIKTTMYEDRLKVPKILHTDEKFDNYAEQAFVDNSEAMFFISRFTREERIKTWITPFSCGDKYRMPFYKISYWLLGGTYDS